MSLFAMDDQSDIFHIDDKNAIVVKTGEYSDYKAITEYYKTRTKSGLPLLCKVILKYIGEDTFGPIYIDKSYDCSIDYGQFIHKLSEDDSSKVISKIYYSIYRGKTKGFNR